MKTILQVENDFYPDRVVYDREAILSLLKCRLSIIKGEYVPNAMLGIPLGANKDEIDLNIQQIILKTTGVTGILEFSSYLKDKKYSCRFIANTIYGRVVYV